MFALLRRLFGPTAKDPQPAPREAFVRLNEHAPLASPAPQAAAPAAARPPTSVLCREAVLGRDQKVAGYQFMHHEGTRHRLENRSRAIRHAYAEVMVRSLVSFAVDRLLGHRLAFIDLPDTFLGHPSLAELEPSRLVAVLEAHDGDDPDPEALAEQVAALRARGTRIALHGNHLAARHASLLPQADYLVFSQAGDDPAVLARHIASLHTARPEAQLLVRRLASFDDFHLVAKLGASLFQGAFVTSREPWEGRALGPSTARLADLMARLKRDADTRELADVLKRDGALSVRLLRYINSAAVGLHEKVTSFERALQLLGRDRLHRWLTLLMLAADGTSARSAAVLENALVRARMLELLGRGEPPEVREELFMTGLLSLIDVVLEMPIGDALDAFATSPTIAAAILDGEGRLAQLLALAQACEQADAQALAEATESTGIGADEASRCHLDALAWALEVGD